VRGGKWKENSIFVSEKGATEKIMRGEGGQEEKEHRDIPVLVGKEG